MPVQHTLSELASLIDGELRGPDTIVDGASIDSRTVAAGNLFVPIVAERDGHDFIETAVAAGAAAHLTSEPNRVIGSALLVADTAAALSAIGSVSRDRLGAGPGRSDVIGVTGSVGKTSVKDLIAATIGADRPTHANPASFNNELGLPLTLTNTPDGAETVVLEMGARGVGHIASLCAIGRPTVGLVTRVAEAHTELFGSLDGVARAKGELIEAVPADGVAIVNADDPRVAAMATRASARVLRYGTSGATDAAGVDVWVSDLELDESLRPRFTVNTPDGSRPVRLSVSGAHMASNAAAAITAALAVGVDLDVAVGGVGEARLSALRMDVTVVPSGATVINDAYNANPTSMRAALDALTSLEADARIAVLGVMAELGEDGEADHRAIAAEAAAAGIRVIALDAPAYGPDALHVDSIDAAFAAVGEIGSGDAVLVKGSRVAQLERLVPRFSARS